MGTNFELYVSFSFPFPLFCYAVSAVSVIRTEMPRQKLLHTLCQQSPCHPTGPPPRSFQKGNSPNCRHLIPVMKTKHSRSKMIIGLHCFVLLHNMLSLLSLMTHVVCFLPIAKHYDVTRCLGISVISLNKPVMTFFVHDSS